MERIVLYEAQLAWAQPLYVIFPNQRPTQCRIGLGPHNGEGSSRTFRWQCLRRIGTREKADGRETFRGHPGTGVEQHAAAILQGQLFEI